MRRIFRVVVDSHLRRAGIRYMSDSNQFEIIVRDVLIRALDFDSDAFPGLEQYAVGTNFDIKFVDLAGFQRLTLGVRMNRLPGLGFGRVELALRTSQPTASQQCAAA